MATYRARLAEFESMLQRPQIDRKRLNLMCSCGIPDKPGMRALCWKILLNYLPIDRSLWEETLAKKRALYNQFIQELIIIPGAKRRHEGNSVEDHPLNPNPNSEWSQYFKDNEVLLQIDKDTRRLLPEIALFQRATAYPCLPIINAESCVETLRKRVEYTVLNSGDVGKNWLGITNVAKKRSKLSDEYATLPEGQEAHWEVVERILFLYAKLNPGQGYVQGMNEIIGPIYYIFASDSDQSVQEFAEADAFFCFTNLMSEIRDSFIKSLDDTAMGINATMTNLMMTLKVKDMRLWARLNEQDLKPQFFGFRWLTLLLSQEFPLPDVIRLWDALFSDDRRFEFLIYVCCAMLVLVRDDLLNNDFPSNMKLLQNYPSIDVNVLIGKAADLRR
ncbi:TBC1 domain family member 13-like isoform X2 [Ptychodera flava]|uniref:TBC1 domain family member 13-like isoform X2 n=2 Tax=Ptychodera flava TaxID=63121 RepID=UPI00396A9E93